MADFEKSCAECRLAKPAADYYRHPLTADRLHHVCKECHKRRMRERRRRNPAVQAYDRLRRKGTKRPPAVRPNDQKRRAQVAASNAIRDGRLKKAPCENCGATERVHGHHEDYSKPFELVWLCARCHMRLHAGHFTVETMRGNDAPA